MRHMALIFLLSCAAFGQATCTAKFSVVLKDDLNNVKQGVSPDTLKWLENKVAKKYPEVCYASPTDAPPLVFFITSSPATYYGSRTVTDSETVPVRGTVTDQDGNVSTVDGTTTSTSHRTVPQT